MNSSHFRLRKDKSSFEIKKKEETSLLKEHR